MATVSFPALATLQRVLGLFDDIATARLQRPDGTLLALLHSPAPEALGTTILVHGLTGSKEDFLVLLPELAAQGYDAWALDLRGIFESPSQGPFDLDTLAGDVVALAEYVGGPVHLVGHSFGGLVSQRAVIARPDLFASLTLLCSGPAGFAQSAERIPITMERITRFRDEVEGHTLEEAWDAKTEFENVEVHPAMASFLKERFVSGSHAAVLAQLEAVVSAPDVLDDVIATGVPGYVAYGAGDGTWAQLTQNETADRLGHAPVVIPDSVHLPMLENADDTATTLAGFFAA